MKYRREQVWFVALVFLGTGAVSILAYLEQIGGDAGNSDHSPVVEAGVQAGVQNPADTLDPALPKHFYNRRGTPERLNPQSEKITVPNNATKQESTLPPSMRVSPNGNQGTDGKPRHETYPPDNNVALPSSPSPVNHALAPASDTDGIKNATGNRHAPAIEAKLDAPIQAKETAAKQRNDGREYISDKPPSSPMQASRLPAGTHPTERAEGLPLKPNSVETGSSSLRKAASKTQPKRSTFERTGALPPRQALNSGTARSPFGRHAAQGPGWTQAPTQSAKKKTRFADVRRPQVPGAGPIFARHEHPGLKGVLDGHDEPIHAVRVSPSGRAYVSASENGTVRHWDAKTGLTTQSLNSNRSLLLAADWSRDWQTFALLGCSVQGCSVEVRGMESGGSLQESNIPRAHIGSVALSPDARLAAVATDEGRVTIFSYGTKHSLTWRAHESGVWTLAFDPFGRYLATGGMDHKVRLWEPREATLVHTIDTSGGAVHKVAFTPNGLYVASAGADSVIRLHRASTGELVTAFTGHLGTVRSLAFDASGRRLASAGDRTLRIWDLATGQELQSIGWDFAITSLAFSPDGHTLLAGDVVGLISVWDSRIGAAVYEQHAHSQ
jgi:hypothetical protein